jgi:hypothetical protein
MPFSCFNFIKQALSVSHLTVTLRMMSNNCRSVSSIGFDFSIGMLLLRWKNQLWHYLLDDCHHFFKFYAIRTVLFACFIYWHVIIDHWCRSAVVTHHSQSNCLMRNCCGLIIKSKSWKLTLKYLNAPVTLNSSDLSLGIQCSVLSLVTLSL